MIIPKGLRLRYIFGIFLASIFLLSMFEAVIHAQQNTNSLMLNNTATSTISNNLIPAILSVIIIIFILIFFLAIHFYDKKSATRRSVKDAGMNRKNENIPSGVLKYIKIRITNNQNINTLSNYQQMLTLDLSSYKNYINKEQSNIIFFDLNGNILKSWLESSTGKNFNNMLYWVVINSQINASSYLDINIGFLDHNVGKNNNSGIAPNLTEKYGSFDNGSEIFEEYWNFELNYLQSEWLTSSECNYSLTKGLTMKSGSIYTNECMYDPANSIIEASIRLDYMEDSQQSGLTISGSRHMGNIQGINRPAVLLLCNPTSKHYANLSVLASNGMDSKNTFNIQNERSIHTIKYNNNYIIGILATQDQLFEYINYEVKASVYAVMNGMYYVILGDSAGIESKGTSILPISFNWVRIRKILPNNVMPKAEIIF